MNISSLSQQLNMSVQELRHRMREAGFYVSPRARKINNNVAKEIINKLSGRAEISKDDIGTAGPSQIEVPGFISVKDFAQKLERPVSEVIKKLIENGVMATINEEIDADTASIIGGEFDVEVIVNVDEGVAKLGLGEARKLIQEEAKTGVLRPPVVAVMGHVDHGKTTLLDTLRKTNVAAKEAGAITQHIGAYQTEHEGKKITFLDTPGHEAFAAMRARGANVTDIIVLVVAADDSVKPQTVEVINRAKLTKTPMIVAINKIDKPNANPDKVTGDLSELGVTVEEWGGSVPAVLISAKTGEGLDRLLETILLVSEVEEFKANSAGQTLGVVIESHLSRGQGPVATILVQNGTLQLGDPILVGGAYGKIRSMEDASGKKMSKARPSTPAKIAGLSNVPKVGDVLEVAESVDEAKQKAVRLQKQDQVKRLRARQVIETAADQRELKLILRADVEGSLEAVVDELSKLASEDVKLTIVDQKAGEINESDIENAKSTGSIIIGFNTKINPAALKIAKQKQVQVDLYDVIYELLENVTQALLKMMPVEVVETILGRVKIKAVFRTEKKTQIVGGVVSSGRVVDKKKFRIKRKDQIVGGGKIEELQQNKVEVSDVSEGKECGIKVEGSAKIEEGDVLEVFDEEVKKKTLS